MNNQNLSNGPMNLSARKKQGFTLIEVLIALTVLAVVFSVSIPVFVSFAGINRNVAQQLK